MSEWMIFKCVYTMFSTMQFPNLSQHSLTQSMNWRAAQSNSTNTRMNQPNIPFQGNSYYSTFHRTPERKIFKKDEWETFTISETKKALRELVSSPDFNAWAADNADRLTLTPPPDARRTGSRRRLFGWRS